MGEGLRIFLYKLETSADMGDGSPGRQKPMSRPNPGIKPRLSKISYPAVEDELESRHPFD